MARGELMKKLITSYGRDDTFRSVVEQIIGEEERKGNRVLAGSMRKSLDRLGENASRPAPGSKLLPFPDEARPSFSALSRDARLPSFFCRGRTPNSSPA